MLVVFLRHRRRRPLHIYKYVCRYMNKHIRAYMDTCACMFLYMCVRIINIYLCETAYYMWEYNDILVNDIVVLMPKKWITINSTCYNVILCERVSGICGCTSAKGTELLVQHLKKLINFSRLCTPFLDARYEYWETWWNYNHYFVTKRPVSLPFTKWNTNNRRRYWIHFPLIFLPLMCRGEKGKKWFASIALHCYC